jgi:hypothetical protein
MEAAPALSAPTEHPFFTMSSYFAKEFFEGARIE